MQVDNKKEFMDRFSDGYGFLKDAYFLRDGGQKVLEEVYNYIQENYVSRGDVVGILIGYNNYLSKKRVIKDPLVLYDPLTEYLQIIQKGQDDQPRSN